MIRFECDYGEGAAQPVLDLLQKTNLEQTPGYGMDDYCDQARGLIRKLCDAPDAGVHFFVGATQANFTVVDALLKPWQGVLCADSGHINVHETGAVESLGHKVLSVPHKDGKLDAIIGRDREVYRTVQILCRRQKNNPCLIGEPGVGKTAIAEGLAQKLSLIHI